MMRIGVVALVVVIGTAAAWADDDKPPELFQDLGKSVGAAGFHLDDRDPEGWEAASICKRAAKLKACKLMKGSWRSSVVADEKQGGQAVVQELWSFSYGSVADARRGLASLEKDFEWGPFNKHPYHLFRCKAQVIAIEGRARWHTARKVLREHVAAWLDEHCDQG